MPLMQVLREDGSAQGTEDFTEPMAVLRGRVEAIQRAQVALMRPLLFYPPSVAESLSTVATHRGSKTAFHAFVIFLVQKNVGVLRQVPPPGTSHNSTLVNLFFVVLWFLGPAFQIPAFGRPPSRAASSPQAASPTHGVSGGCSGSADGDPDPGGAPRNGAAAAERLEIQACAAEPTDAGLQPQSPIAAVEPPDLTAIVTARNGATAPTSGRSPRRNGSKKSRKSCSKELDRPDCGGRSCSCNTIHTHAFLKSRGQGGIELGAFHRLGPLAWLTLPVYPPQAGMQWLAAMDDAWVRHHVQTIGTFLKCHIITTQRC